MWVRHKDEMVNLDRIEQISLSEKLNTIYFIGNPDDSECPAFVYESKEEAISAFHYICKVLREVLIV